MTYTHTHGAQNRFMEFTKPILKDNKPGGPWALLAFGRSSRSETPLNWGDKTMVSMVDGRYNELIQGGYKL